MQSLPCPIVFGFEKETATTRRLPIGQHGRAILSVTVAANHYYHRHIQHDP